MVEFEDADLGPIKVVNITEARSSIARIMSDNQYSYVITKNNKPIRILLNYQQEGREVNTSQTINNPKAILEKDNSQLSPFESRVKGLIRNTTQAIYRFEKDQKQKRKQPQGQQKTSKDNLLKEINSILRKEEQGRHEAPVLEASLQKQSDKPKERNQEIQSQKKESTSAVPSLSQNLAEREKEQKANSKTTSVHKNAKEETNDFLKEAIPARAAKLNKEQRLELKKENQKKLSEMLDELGGLKLSGE